MNTGIGATNGDSWSQVDTLHDVRQMWQDLLTCTRKWSDDWN